MSASGDKGAEFIEESSKACDFISKQIQELAERLVNIATVFDSAGDAKTHPTGSPARIAAELRDHADMCLSQAVRYLQALMRIRAETSHSVDLMVESIMMEKGDGSGCLKLIEKYYERTGDPTEGEGTVIPSTFPDAFFWETVRRVEAIPDLAERYPEHLRFAAAHFQGLPMMVSHHIDITPEFVRLAELLRMGSQHPLDVSPRRKRGGITPAMNYLEPLVWRMHSLWSVMMENDGAEHRTFSSTMISNMWASDFNEKIPDPQIESLRKLATLPRLTKITAPAWTKEVIVPYILVSDGTDPATSDEPFIRNIWNHRDVKSIPTFRSRLESAVNDFLERYSRDD
jgi:hypothetical protein